MTTLVLQIKLVSRGTQNNNNCGPHSVVPCGVLTHNTQRSRNPRSNRLNHNAIPAVTIGNVNIKVMSIIVNGFRNLYIHSDIYAHVIGNSLPINL